MSEREFEDDDSEDESSIDDVFRVLKNQRRRKVIDTIGPDSPMQLGSLAEVVAAFEYDCDVDEVTASQRKRVYVALFQSHLPLMDDTGVIEFDKDRSVISSGPKFEQYAAVMDATKRVYEESQAPDQSGAAGSALDWLRSFLG